jgi:site-specific recombinase XerD
VPNARGYFEGKVWMGYRPDGRPDRRHVQRKSLAAVRRAVRELERQRDAGLSRGPGRLPTVRAMLDRHLDIVLPQRGRAPGRIRSYRSLAEQQIFPRWGGQRIDRLQATDIEDGLAAMRQAGLAAASVRKALAVLSSALEIEARRGNIARNPCKLVEPPRLARADKTALTAGQAHAILTVVAGRRNAARWSVGLAYGLRQGEALGLRWQYVDFDRGELRIWHQMQRVPWRHGCADPGVCCADRHRRACLRRCPKAARKSGRTHVCVQADDKGLCPPGCQGHAAMCPQRKDGGLQFRQIKEGGHKTVPLPAQMAAILKAHRTAQLTERMLVRNVWEDHDLVFAQENGRPIDSRADWQEWSGILAEAGIPHHGVHVMRHSAATIMLETGVPLAVVQEILGHSDIRITRAYSHVSSRLAEDAASRMGEALFGSTVPTTVPRRSAR